MKFSEPICKDTDGYSKFVMPEYQHPCNSEEYNAIVEGSDYQDDLKLLNIDYDEEKHVKEWPCCDVPSEYVKDGKNDDYTLEEARKSFMSGHSSFSFYCATFLVIYLHVRLSNDQFQETMLVKEGTIVARTLLRCIIF